MDERDLAMQLVEEAQKSRAFAGFPYTTIDVSEFGEGKYNLETFKDYTAVLGYKVIPIEESHLRNTPIKNKYVVIGQ